MPTIRIDNYGVVEFAKVEKIDTDTGDILGTVMKPPMTSRMKNPIYGRKIRIPIVSYKQYMADKEPIFNWIFDN